MVFVLYVAKLCCEEKTRVVAMFLTARVADKNIEQERNEIMKWMKVEGLSALLSKRNDKVGIKRYKDSLSELL
eukprot:scaffold43635_cov153-Skeletonema_marinoi.AAC.1